MVIIIILLQFKLLYRHFFISNPFPGVGLTVPFLLWIPGWWLGLVALGGCYAGLSRGLTGRKMTFVSMVYSFLFQNPLGLIFISLLMHYVHLSHSALLCSSMRHLNLKHVVNFADIEYFFFFFLFVTPKTSFDLLQVCISLTELLSFLQLLGLRCQPVPHLFSPFCAASCLSSSQGLCYCARTECLYMTSLCYSQKYLILHKIITCQENLYKTMVAPLSWFNPSRQ